MQRSKLYVSCPNYCLDIERINRSYMTDYDMTQYGDMAHGGDVAVAALSFLWSYCVPHSLQSVFGEASSVRHSRTC